MKKITLLLTGFLLAFSFFSPLALALDVGDQVPDLKLKNQNGKLIGPRDYKGQFVLLYFYPKDETKGCTVEATTLRDHSSEFKKHNTVILGISRQDEKSHQDFIAKHKLPFDLLVDKDGSFSRALGMELVPLVGLNKRQSVLIGPDQKVVRFYRDVSPEKHAEEVLADVSKK